MSSGRTRLRLVSLACALLCANAAGAASIFDPALKFRVRRTEHFEIFFHQDADHLAARLAVIAEDAWHALERPMGTRPPRRTRIVLADQTEQANGYATPLPYDTIVIYTTWPRSAEFDADDWLRLVITHEFTHIVHLDRSESWARVVRGVFGRTFIAFPNLFLPQWQIEGLATYEESAITGEGRLHAGDFRVVVDEAARRGALEPLDRVNGGLTDWPVGQGPYAYGVGFHQFLVDRFGAAKLGELATATARRVPYTSPPVFQKVFGRSLGSLWSDYEQSLADAAGPPALDVGMRQLTHHGFVAAGPRFDPVGGGIVYSKRTPDAFPTLERIDESGHATTLATRYLGSTAGFGRSSIFFDQFEVARSVALLADLYTLDRETGRVTRLTFGARYRDPDVSPDGKTIVAVREHVGRRDLVLIDAAAPSSDPTVVASDPDTNFDTPRWSPDGRRIAVERHRLGHDPEIVVVDPASRAVRIVAAAGHARIAMPAWRPDGLAVVAAVAPGDRVFNLYEFPVNETGVPRQLTHTASGVTWPDVSADGKTILCVGYTTAGYDVFSMPYPDDAGPALNLRPPVAESSATRVEQSSAAPTPPYSPFGTLAPTSWQPLIEWDSDQVRLGAAVFGRDVLGYHAYSASATWLLSSPSNAPTPSGATPDWFLSYSYARWWPTLFVAASEETSFFTGPATDAGTPSAAVRREQQVEAGVVLPFLKTRQSHTALATVFHANDDYDLGSRSFDRRRTAPRAAWRSATARTYGYSISPEDGIVAGVTGEWVRRAFGSSGEATTTTGDFRAYLPGIGPHHVIAARVAGGVSSGDPTVGRTFLLGGPGPDLSATDFGSDAVSVLRGFPSDSFAGTRVALVNADYRWPLARPQRGYGTWPFFLHTLHAAVFADAGKTWTRAFDDTAFKTSLGGELSFNIVAGFYFPFTATVGAAWGHDSHGAIQNRATAFFRVGRSF